MFERAAPATACSLHTKCMGQYKEGCVVGPRTQKLELAISPACAGALMQAASCADFEATISKPLCR